MNNRKRSFAFGYLSDENGTKAAIRAGYSEKSARQQAFRLLRDVAIKAEIERLRALHRDRLNVTVERLTAQFHEDRDLAIKNKQPSAAVQADTALAKLHGLMVDKTEITKAVNDMTDEEIRDERARLQRLIDEAERSENGDPETRH